MQVTAFFFGATADVIGKREIKIDVANGLTVGEVIGQLTQLNPGLSKHKLLVALNEEYVSPDASVKNGDTLAVFTAVSGG